MVVAPARAMATLIGRMGLTQSWVGAAMRAAGATLLVPLTLLAAVAAIGLGGGGIHGLGALRQTFSGPVLPGAGSARVGRPAAAPRRAAVIPPAPGPAVPGATGVGAGAPGAAPAPRGGGGGGGPRARVPSPSTPAPAPTDGGTTTGAAPPPPPPKQPGPVRRVAQPVRDKVAALPPPVGPTAAPVIDTADGVLPPGH